MRSINFVAPTICLLLLASGCAQQSRQEWNRAFDSAGEAISDDAQLVKNKASQAGRDVKRTVKNLVSDEPRDSSRISPEARTLDCSDPDVRAAARPGECYN